MLFLKITGLLVCLARSLPSLSNFFWTASQLALICNFIRLSPIQRTLLGVMCRIEVESSEHLLMRCTISARVWSCVFSWLGFVFEMPQGVTRLYTLQKYLLRGKKKVKKFRFLFWHATVWSIWLVRNEMIFNNGNFELLSIMELIKLRSWAWFSAAQDFSCCNFTHCCLCPISCIN